MFVISENEVMLKGKKHFSFTKLSHFSTAVSKLWNISIFKWSVAWIRTTATCCTCHDGITSQTNQSKAK